MADDVAEWQRDWRAIVIKKLDNLEDGQKQIERELSDLKLNYTKDSDFRDLERRVGAVERARAQLVTLLLVLQAALVFAWEFVLRKLLP